MTLALIWTVLGSPPLAVPLTFPFSLTVALLLLQDGETALMRAAYKGHGDIIRMLLEAKGDPDLQDNVRPSP